MVPVRTLGDVFVIEHSLAISRLGRLQTALPEMARFTLTRRGASAAASLTLDSIATSCTTTAHTLLLEIHIV